MPRLFWMDDWDSCLAARRAFYCLGSFRLSPLEPSKLFDFMTTYSKDRHHYNHTLLHRGYCITSRCSHIGVSSSKEKFVLCVDQYTRNKYGLRATLAKLEYCRRSDVPEKRVDKVEMMFAAIVAVIIFVNIIGTTYDLKRNPDKKHKYADKYLLPWSMRVSWRRLTADHATSGDPRLTALNPIQGTRAVTLLVVMMAHTVIAFEISYLQNPEFVEKAKLHPLTMLLYNGSVIVQGFFVVSSFLLAYNLLLFAEKNPDKNVSLRMLPQCLLHRICRILPVHMFAVGLMATWWPRVSDGPLWASHVRAESARCRSKWWAHLLFLNNLVRPDEKCLIQSWFLAVDMQLYVVVCALALLLLRRPRAAFVVLPILVAVSVIANFLIAYHWGLKPIVMVMNPEVMRGQYVGEPSFKWLYAAPWASLPASLLGLLCAFLHRHIQLAGYKPQENRVVMFLYRWSLPLILLWILSGHLVEHSRDAIVVALYAALDRVGYAIICGFAHIGFFHNIDSVLLRFIGWRGWRTLGRLSLSALMLHWNFVLLQVAINTQTARVAIYEIAGQWYNTIILTYASALPLYLLLEAPAQKFLQALFFCNNKP
ncbi:O-acyltransferase like protein-like isoform X2 [Hyposmocoma kahamanoa]|nr:O-acyltransferase like protein-like isoform X2 [Hyposmocoma kahamanoa]XP_026313460.1 O-acyltransferase like protein-like isoform X2 [Hyposmocoma kahamanoa]